MGGDLAPAAPVAAALLAAATGVDVVLVGDRRRLQAQLDGHRRASSVTIVDAASAVGMDEDPAVALRGKPDASILVAARVVADGSATAVVSAGSTGATLAACLLTFGRLPGIRRPAVAAVLPTSSGSGSGSGGSARQVVLIDAGGSSDAQPDVITGYAVMGTAYARVLGVASPRVGLLNVGAEAGKGSAVAKAAHAALRSLDGFVGNTEPQGVLAGDVDVVVTDGFTGNVFLKTVEAVAQRLRGQADRQATGVLLGVAGDAFIAHGAATAAELAAALQQAAQVPGDGLFRRVSAELTAATPPVAPAPVRRGGQR